MQGRTVETFEWAEEAKSRDVRNKDPRYQRLLKARALDPLSQKKLSSVQSKFMYLEQQMDEVNTKLDMEWDAHLEKCKVCDYVCNLSVKSLDNFFDMRFHVKFVKLNLIFYVFSEWRQSFQTKKSSTTF